LQSLLFRQSSVNGPHGPITRPTEFYFSPQLCCSTGIPPRPPPPTPLSFLPPIRASIPFFPPSSPPLPTLSHLLVSPFPYPPLCFTFTLFPTSLPLTPHPPTYLPFFSLSLSPPNPPSHLSTLFSSHQFALHPVHWSPPHITTIPLPQTTSLSPIPFYLLYPTSSLPLPYSLTSPTPDFFQLFNPPSPPSSSSPSPFHSHSCLTPLPPPTPFPPFSPPLPGRPPALHLPHP